MGLSLVILIVVVGVMLFVLKLLMTKTAAWVERTFNADIAAATEIANEHRVPQAWRDAAAAVDAGDPDGVAARRDVLRQLDQVIRRVEGGRAFEPDAREHALTQLRAVRERWGTQSWQEILGHASVSGGLEGAGGTRAPA